MKPCAHLVLFSDAIRACTLRSGCSANVPPPAYLLLYTRHRYAADQEAWQQLAELCLEARQYQQAAFCLEELVLASPLNYVYSEKYAEVGVAAEHRPIDVKMGPSSGCRCSSVAIRSSMAGGAPKFDSPVRCADHVHHRRFG